MVSVPRGSVLLFVLGFHVKGKDLACQAPISGAKAFVGPTLLVWLNRCFLCHVKASFVRHGTLALPIYKEAGFTRLLCGASTMFFSPLPTLVRRFFANRIHLVSTLLFWALGRLCLYDSKYIVHAQLPRYVMSLRSLMTSRSVLRNVVRYVSRIGLANGV